MKKIVLILLCCIFTSCGAQNKEFFDLKRKDVIAFNFSENDIKLLESIYDQEIYNHNGIIVFKRNWVNIGKDYFEKQFVFVKQLDTMKISCNCGQGKNLYFKNIKFKKKAIKIELPSNLNLEKAGNTFLDKELNNIEVINSYNSKNKGQKDTFVNSPFKELNFLIVDEN